MHKQEQNLQSYLDGELGREDRAKVEQHLGTCPSCQTRLTELKTLASVLQSWTLPTGLSQLTQPLALPARPLKSQIKVGVVGWIGGVVVALLFIIIRAIFLLSGQLNWMAYGADVAGLDGGASRLALNLRSGFNLQPFFLTTLGEAGERIGLLVAFILPLLLYVICVGGITVFYLNWFNLTLVRQPKKTRS
jgi:predicted anti-sigma-YlaC factor YlaD